MVIDDDNEVWSGTVDNGRFVCKVQRSAPYAGILTVFDSKGGIELLHEQVVLSYQAMFGPDVDDVRDWQERCITVIDECVAKDD